MRKTVQTKVEKERKNLSVCYIYFYADMPAAYRFRFVLYAYSIKMHLNVIREHIFYIFWLWNLIHQISLFNKCQKSSFRAKKRWEFEGALLYDDTNHCLTFMSHLGCEQTLINEL